MKKRSYNMKEEIQLKFEDQNNKPVTLNMTREYFFDFIKTINKGSYVINITKIDEDEKNHAN